MDSAIRDIDWFEVKRKTAHIFVGVILAFLIYYNIITWWILLIALLAGISISLVSKKNRIILFDWMLNKFERSEYLDTFPGRGVIFLFLGLTIIMVLFNKQIVFASLMIWAFGDSISALVGKHYGRYKHPLNDARLIEGTIAGILFATIAASFFVPVINAFIASFIAIFVESIELKFIKKPIDDNFLVPVISAVMLWILILI